MCLSDKYDKEHWRIQRWQRGAHVLSLYCDIFTIRKANLINVVFSIVANFFLTNHKRENTYAPPPSADYACDKGALKQAFLRVSLAN